MADSLSQSHILRQAAKTIRDADALLIGAGAGMGVDSGLPDFRGDAGFWKAYPPFQAAGLTFQDLAQPGWFRRDPALAWGFYGHRLNLYRRTMPHAGFDILRQWVQDKPAGGFVFTSNVDGQFQKAGFPEDRIVECHGSIHSLQCSRPCSRRIWSADATLPAIDEATFRAELPLPLCPACGAVARPNILMFNDGGWLPERVEAQEEALDAWLREVRGSSVALLECGAGTAIPTVRSVMEQFARRLHAPLIRINVREAYGPPGTLSLSLGAKEALIAVEQLLV
jgi:NAD-dependent SIR2 family protein deacetylase